MNVRLLRSEELPRTEELFALAFEIAMERKPDAQPDEALHWAAFDDDGEMMSTLTVTDFTVQFDSNACRMGGIGGVATLPQYRRRGGIRGCFTAFLPELFKRGYDFSYLYPFSSRFYRQFGYENCVQKQHVTVDLSLLRREEIGGSYRLAETNRDLSADVRAVDAVWESSCNMMVHHDDEFYSWVRKQDPAVKQEFCFVWYRPDGTPGAYTVYRKENQSDGRNLVCSKFRYLDRAGFRALLNLFQSLAADHRYVKFLLPEKAALRHLFPEWSLGAVSWQIRPAGMVRVIRAQDVLQKAQYIGSGAVALELHDAMIPQNNGCFTVCFADGKALYVEKTEAEPDVKMDITAFSALISGTCDFRDAAEWMDGITLLNPAAPLDRVFYRKNLFLEDYF